MSAAATLAPTVSSALALTVIHDDSRPFGTWWRAWLESQPQSVPMRLVPAGSDEATERLGVLGTGQDLVVVADDGRAWVGAKALIVCLWATARHRALALRLASPVGHMSAEAYYAQSIAPDAGIIASLLSSHPGPRPGVR